MTVYAGNPAPKITVRQYQILVCVAEGMTNKEICDELNLSFSTVALQLRQLFRKIDAKDRAHAVLLGFRSGVLK